MLTHYNQETNQHTKSKQLQESPNKNKTPTYTQQTLGSKFQSNQQIILSFLKKSLNHSQVKSLMMAKTFTSLRMVPLKRMEFLQDQMVQQVTRPKNQKEPGKIELSSCNLPNKESEEMSISIQAQSWDQILLEK